MQQSLLLEVVSFGARIWEEKTRREWISSTLNDNDNDNDNHDNDNNNDDDDDNDNDDDDDDDNDDSDDDDDGNDYVQLYLMH